MTNLQSEAAALLIAIDNAVTRVRTKSLDFSFNELLDMYNNDELIIDPDFQRLFRWDEIKQSQFIESLILELPIPPIYVIEIEDGKYELIDGLQRLSSYFHFRGKHPDDKLNPPNDPLSRRILKFQGCDVLKTLNGHTYDELPSAVQIRLKRQSVRTEVFRKESDKRLRYYMFKRLNTGGEPLSDQEIRNCTIRLLDNRFNQFLKDCAQNADFISCMSELTDEKREQKYMEEYVLRFFAMKNVREKYEKDIRPFLTEYMEAVSDPDRSGVSFAYASESSVFANTFRILNEALGTAAFSGVNAKGTPMGYFSALHFEALSLGLQKHLGALAQADAALKQKFKDALIELKKDVEFQKLTKGGGKNYAAALRQRIEFVEGRVAACLS